MTGLLKIDRFTQLKELAEGSFGPIYLAQDEAADQQVVIKLCSIEEQRLRRRFATEAEMAVKLRHPNVAQVLESGLVDGQPYLVQEYLPGDDLGQIISQRTPWRGLDKLQVLLQVARGLGYAHSQGIAHLDFKPSNARLSAGVIKVMDFGISRLASSETRSTQRGVTLATASYLPPEQVRSGSLDHRVDVFAFGAFAFELMTYQRPFRGQTLSALVYQILYKEPVAMASVWPQCPPPLDKMLMTCLAKDRELRYAGFPQVGAVLEGLLKEAQEGKHPALMAAATALPESEDLDDVMSQSMVTRTAASVSNVAQDPGATQRVQALGDTPPRPTAAVGNETVRIDRSTLPEPPKPPAAVESTPVADSQAAAEDSSEDLAESATITLPKVTKKPKVGATTRTKQPAIEVEDDVGDDLADDINDVDDEPTLLAQRAKNPVGAATQPAEVQEPASSEQPPPPPAPAATAAPAAPAAPAATPAPVAPPPAPPMAAMSKELPTEAPAEAPPADAAVSKPKAELSQTGKLALTAQEISALIAQGKIDEAQQHLAAMQSQESEPQPEGQTAVDADDAIDAELPTMTSNWTPTSSKPPSPAVSVPSPPMAPVQAVKTPPDPAIPAAGPPPLSPTSSGKAPPPKSSTPPRFTPQVGAKPDVGTLGHGTPGQVTLDRTSAVPPAKPVAQGKGKLLFIGLGLAVVLVLLALAAWWFLGRSVTEAPPEVVVPPPTARTTPQDAAVPVDSGWVQIDATPWGSITEITDSSGYLVDLPADPLTPMVLELPVGSYRIVLSHRLPETLDTAAALLDASGDVAPEEVPEEATEVQIEEFGSGEVSECQVDVALGEWSTCRVMFVEENVTDYFKDAGWWQ